MLNGKSRLVAILLLSACGAARAQNAAPGGAPSAPASQPKAAALAPTPVGLTLVQRYLLMNDINDIDRSRTITPLHLTPDQLKKAIGILDQLTADYERKVSMVTDRLFSPFMGELKDVKARVYGGGTIPKDFDARMKHAMDSFVSIRKQLNLDNIASASNALENILTPSQVAIAANLAKNSPANEGLYSATTSDAQWYHLYVGKVFLSYPRIVPLLQNMLKAQEPAPVKSSSGTDATSTASRPESGK